VYRRIEGWWDILLLLYYKFTAIKSVGETILKIGQYWHSYRQKYSGIFLPDTEYFFANKRTTDGLKPGSKDLIFIGSKSLYWKYSTGQKSCSCVRL